MALTPTEHPLVDFGSTSFHLSFPTHRDPPPHPPDLRLLGLGCDHFMKAD